MKVTLKGLALKINAYCSDQPIICTSAVERFFGITTSRINVIISTAPIKGSKRFVVFDNGPCWQSGYTNQYDWEDLKWSSPKRVLWSAFGKTIFSLYPQGTTRTVVYVKCEEA